MFIFTPGENKKYGRFEEGVRLIRRRNGHFFDNTISGNSIYDLADINCYFDIRMSLRGIVLQFRKNSGLPEKIRSEICTLFYSLWPGSIEDAE